MMEGSGFRSSQIITDPDSKAPKTDGFNGSGIPEKRHWKVPGIIYED